MHTSNGDPGIVPNQVWEYKNRMDGRRVRVVSINYETGEIKLEWRPLDNTHPYHETDLTNFVQRFRRVEETTPLTAA